MKDFSLAACTSGLVCHQGWASAHLWGFGYLNIWIPHTPISEFQYTDFVCRYLFLNCRFIRILQVISPGDSQTHNWQLSWLTPAFSCKLPYFSPTCGLSLLMWAQTSCLQRWIYVFLPAQVERALWNPRATLVHQHLPQPSNVTSALHSCGGLGVLSVPRHTATTLQDLHQYF